MKIRILVTGGTFDKEYDELTGALFFLLTAPPKNRQPAPNHSPLFDFDEDAMPVGAKALAALALDQLIQPK